MLTTLARMGTPHTRTGLILMGGGARAAYQVGVLGAIAEIAEQVAAPTTNPFPIIAGTSAGAINAAGLACGADDFGHAVRSLHAVWSALHAEQVYRADSTPPGCPRARRSARRPRAGPGRMQRPGPRGSRWATPQRLAMDSPPQARDAAVAAVLGHSPHRWPHPRSVATPRSAITSAATA